MRADRLAALVDASHWQRRSAGDGAKGPRVYDWARVELRPLMEPGKGYWLLARRSVTKPGELAYYVCFGLEGTSLEELVRIAGARWAIEECFEEAKGQVGLDQYEVRKWDGWHRHITLACWPRPFWRWLGIRRPRGDRVKRGLPRRGGRADTDDGARGAPIALPAGLDALPPGGFGVGLVSVETPTSGQSPALSLSTPPQTSGIICATVVLRSVANRRCFDQPLPGRRRRFQETVPHGHFTASGLPFLGVFSSSLRQEEHTNSPCRSLKASTTGRKSSFSMFSQLL